MKNSVSFWGVGGVHRSLILAALLCGQFLVGGPAFAQSGGETPVCLAKTERTGGRLAFVVRESDASMFEQAGFARFQCPESLDEARTNLAARCVRFRNLDDIGQEMIRDLFDLSVEQMCAATDAWVSSG